MLNRNGGLVKEKYAVRDVLAPIINSLCYLHNLGIVHRDIKPENILVTSCKIMKLADFGLGIDCSAERPVTRCGTLDYLSPEVLLCPDKKSPEENKEKTMFVYGPKVDVWAIGILAYELIVGFPPFERDSRLETFNDIMNTEPNYPHNMSSEAKSFIRDALNKSSETRLDAFDLLKHPWIQQFARAKHLMVEPKKISIDSALVEPPAISSPSMHRLSRASSIAADPNAPLPPLSSPKLSFGVLSDDSSLGQTPPSPFSPYSCRLEPLNTIAKAAHMEPTILRSSSSLT